eukprot:2036891-Rhodomonas_salina.1
MPEPDELRSNFMGEIRHLPTEKSGCVRLHCPLCGLLMVILRRDLGMQIREYNSRGRGPNDRKWNCAVERISGG